jgi:hypothetical protein
MQTQDYATLIVAVMTIFGGFIAAVRWLVKHYLSELRPNSGSSMRDSIDRLEARVDRIYEILCDRQP